MTISGSLNNADKPFGSSRDEKSRIVQMINTSRTSQNQKKDKSGTGSLQDQNEASQSNGPTQLAGIHLEVAKPKQMLLSDGKDVADVQSNPFGSHSSANDMVQMHKGNTTFPVPQTLNPHQLSDE